MDYKQIYLRLCIRGQYRTLDDYTEAHHILPRSLGGGDEPQNITRLTAREHWVAHKLLVRIHTGEAYYKMVAALVRMIGKREFRQRIRLSSREYAAVQTLNSVMASHRNKRLWATEEHRAKVLKARKRGYFKRTAAERRNTKSMTGSYLTVRVSCPVCRREFNRNGWQCHVRQSHCFNIRELPKRPQRVSCIQCRKLLYTNGLTNHYRFTHR